MFRIASPQVLIPLFESDASVACPGQCAKFVCFVHVLASSLMHGGPMTCEQKDPNWCEDQKKDGPDVQLCAEPRLEHILRKHCDA
jgi:hypothetical protein